MRVLEFAGSMKDPWPGDSEWYLKKPVSPSRLWIARSWLCPHNTSLSFFIQSLYKEETRTEIVQFPLYKGNSKAQSLDPFQLRQYQTWPWGPSTFSFSPGLEKPPNFTIETNIFIQLQMLELNTHTSRTSTSPFCSFGQVICFSLFFLFFFSLCL